MDPTNVIDQETGKVRVLSRRCSTCVFRPGNLMHLRPGKLEALVEHHIASGSLLTCHQTLPYGDHPDFRPAVCAGFWAGHSRSTTAGRIARGLIGIIRITPPAGEENR